MTFIVHRTYSVFNDKDHDLHPDRDSADLKAWRNHSGGGASACWTCSRNWTPASTVPLTVQKRHRHAAPERARFLQSPRPARSALPHARDAITRRDDPQQPRDPLKPHRVHRRDARGVRTGGVIVSEEEEDAGDDQHGAKSDDDGAAQAVKSRLPVRRRRRRGRDATPSPRGREPRQRGR
jgi:hypothetical protein